MLYKHFTDRARKVMELASDHARASRYEFIASEHVLIGLIKERGGVAANVLQSLGLQSVRRSFSMRSDGSANCRRLRRL
ncbi:MAG: hypothetical protein FJ271_18745 [Planctomycetes bacterium]|nr:hypothetical protein [Planctomycetota bacterium]